MLVELDAQFAAGQEVAYRLGYDDVNESLGNRENVMKTLGLLGVTKVSAWPDKG